MELHACYVVDVFRAHAQIHAHTYSTKKKVLVIDIGSYVMRMCKVKSVKFSVSTSPMEGRTKRKRWQNFSNTCHALVVVAIVCPSMLLPKTVRGAFVWHCRQYAGCNLRQTRRTKQSFLSQNFQFTRFVYGARAALEHADSLQNSICSYLRACCVLFEWNFYSPALPRLAYDYLIDTLFFSCSREHAIPKRNCYVRAFVELQLRGHYQIFRLHQSQSYPKVCARRWEKEITAHGSSEHRRTAEQVSARLLNQTTLNLNWIVVPLVRYLPFAMHFLWLYHGCSASSGGTAMASSENIIISSSGIEFKNKWEVRANALAWIRTMEKFQFFAHLIKVKKTHF